MTMPEWKENTLQLLSVACLTPMTAAELSEHRDRRYGEPITNQTAALHAVRRFEAYGLLQLTGMRPTRGRPMREYIVTRAGEDVLDEWFRAKDDADRA